MNPKYSEGESIILQSISHPEYNGEYTVSKIIADGQVYSCRLSGRGLVSVNFGYLLDIPLKDKLEDFYVEAKWYESALRKKHEPSQMSFQSIIQSINSPVKQES